MSFVHYYETIGEGVLFDDNFTINISHPKRKLHRKEITKILGQFGYQSRRKWFKTEMGWETKFSLKLR